MISRRRFVSSAALVSLTPTLPAFISRSVLGAHHGPVSSDRALVVIQLDGGNDGLNTVIPYRDDAYAKFRQRLRLRESDVVKLNDQLALHPSLKTFHQLMERDRLSIVQGVGYPNPNRSHFESMKIWQAGSQDQWMLDQSTGWLGNALGTNDESDNRTHAYHVGGDPLPIALRGRRCQAVSLAQGDDLLWRSPTSPTIATVTPGSDGLADFVTRSVAGAYASANQLRELSTHDSSTRYPDSQLGQNLQLVSQLMKTDNLARVYYTSQSGYDTHANQLPRHESLLAELANALTAFMNDMRASGLDDRVMVLCFSEFGRRVHENDSLGTDHGAAGPVFLAGSKLKSRIFGKHPALDDLDQGDLKYQHDFRAIYGALLREWLELPVPKVLETYASELASVMFRLND